MSARHPPPLALAAALLTALLAATRAAHADDLTLRTRELDGWNDTLAALRLDLGSEGRVLHLQVLDGGARVPCGRYRLTLDEATRASAPPRPLRSPLKDAIGGAAWATVFGTPMAVLFYRGAHGDSGNFIPATVFAIPTAACLLFPAVALYHAARGPEPLPTVTISNRGATFGMAGAF